MSSRWFATTTRTARAPRPCLHHAIAATTLPRMGRCLECDSLVPTPFSIHRNDWSN